MSTHRFTPWLNHNKRLLFRVGLGLVLLPVMIFLGMLLFGLLSMVASLVLFIVVAVLVLGFGLMILAVAEDRFLPEKNSDLKNKDPNQEHVVIDVVTLP